MFDQAAISAEARQRSTLLARLSELAELDVETIQQREGRWVLADLARLAPVLWESGIGSDVMKPIAAPIVGGMITSTIHVLILVPAFFVMMKERAFRKGILQARTPSESSSLSKP
jgi:hypothetical protein